jgi:hypothetical protein
MWMSSPKAYNSEDAGSIRMDFAPANYVGASNLSCSPLMQLVAPVAARSLQVSVVPGAPPASSSFMAPALTRRATAAGHSRSPARVGAHALSGTAWACRSPVPRRRKVWTCPQHRLVSRHAARRGVVGWGAGGLRSFEDTRAAQSAPRRATSGRAKRPRRPDATALHLHLLGSPARSHRIPVSSRVQYRTGARRRLVATHRMNVIGGARVI